jgi:hypothetical protein
MDRVTAFIIALMRMTHDQRNKASPAKAARRYDIPVEWAKWWIDHARATNETWPVKG